MTRWLRSAFTPFSDNAASLKTQLQQQIGVVDYLLNNTQLLVSKIQEAKLKKDTLKARAQSAKFVHILFATNF